MLRGIIFLAEEAPEGGYNAQALGHSIYTEADTWEELKQAVRDAVQCHFEDDQQPTLLRLHVVRAEHLKMDRETLLHSRFEE